MVHALREFRISLLFGWQFQSVSDDEFSKIESIRFVPSPSETRAEYEIS